MKSFFRILLLSLVLIIVALISALTSMRFAIHGRQVAVPKLIGMTPDEAAKAAEDFGLSLKVDRQFYSPSIPAGKIVSQTPEVGATVRRGWRVLVAESLGPVRVSPPDVIGESERAAAINIRRRGLQLGDEAAVSATGKDYGTVLAQNPPANSTSVTSPNVSLLTAGPARPQTYVMPSFVGSPVASATKALTDAHLHVGSLTATPDIPGDAAPLNPIGPASIILSQIPAPGQRVQEGQPVNFEVRP
jgi:eukaryotic-like serine/threonine-protein kinase